MYKSWKSIRIFEKSQQYAHAYIHIHICHNFHSCTILLFVHKEKGIRVANRLWWILSFDRWRLVLVRSVHGRGMLDQEKEGVFVKCLVLSSLFLCFLFCLYKYTIVFTMFKCFNNGGSFLSFQFRLCALLVWIGYQWCVCRCMTRVVSRPYHQHLSLVSGFVSFIDCGSFF